MAFSLIDGGLGVAFKIEDGGTAGPQPHGGGHPGATGRHDPGGRQGPGRLPGAAILNHRQEEVGRIRPAFALNP